MTSGKRSPIWSDGTQYFEGVGNRNIVKKLISKLEEKNIEYFDLMEGSQEDISLHNRAYKCNNIYHNDKRAVLISMHSNGFTQESANGFSIYTSRGETKSDLFASLFIKNMELHFPKHKSRKDYTDGDSDKEADFYVLKKTNCPAILIENFFMTNFRESKLLMSKDFQNRIVDCHFQSICEIENSETFIF